MKKIGDITQYTNLVKKIKFKGKTSKDTFVILYFSENSNFLDDYNKLGILKFDVRNIFIPKSKRPRFFVTGEIKKLYKKLGLIVYSTGQSIPKNKNIFVDLSQYLNLIDTKFKPKNYRLKEGYYIENFIFKMLSMFPKNYNRVLLYTVDSKKDINSFVDRKIFLITKPLKENNIKVDYFLLGVFDKKGVIQYRLLIKNKEYSFNKVLQYLKRTKF